LGEETFLVGQEDITEVNRTFLLELSEISPNGYTKLKIPALYPRLDS